MSRFQPPAWVSALMERLEDLEMQVEVTMDENAELRKKAGLGVR